MKESLAFVFPGQGTQRVGMAEPLFSHRNPDLITIANSIFEEASDLLSTDLKSLCLNGPDEELDTPGITEPAILVTSIAALRFLMHYGSVPQMVAGHSLGEYSALVAAEALSFNQAIRLVKGRGEFMERARLSTSGGMSMAAVLGLSLAEVEALCAESGAEVANINGETQIVISGRTDSILKAKEILKKGKMIEIRVNISSHSSLMEPAKQDMVMLLEHETIQDPKIPFVQNVTAGYATTGNEVKRGLIDQITGRVLWLDSVRFMIREGAGQFIEFGPGVVLSKLIKRIDPSARVHHWERMAS